MDLNSVEYERIINVLLECVFEAAFQARQTAGAKLRKGGKFKR